jgi:hypothetical protein
MDGLLIFRLFLVLLLLVWIVELYLLYQNSVAERVDPVHTLSGAAIFFVAALPVARSKPQWVDGVAGVLERGASSLRGGGGGRAATSNRAPARLLINGEQKPLNQPRVRLGRYPNNEVVLDHSTVSAYHAEIIQRPDGKHEIVDRESRNGTRVNGALVRSQVLKDGDLITLGATSMHYLSDSSSDAEAAALGYPPDIDHDDGALRH